MPQVAILMGSKSDADALKPAEELLDRFGISWESNVISAHRQPEKLHAYIESAEKGGTLIYITAAGLAAALPGVVASMTDKPVIGIPVAGGAMKGFDALLSIVQMPGGIPVATVGVGSNGPKNAAVLSARILALSDEGVAAKLHEYREELRNG